MSNEKFSIGRYVTTQSNVRCNIRSILVATSEQAYCNIKTKKKTTLEHGYYNIRTKLLQREMQHQKKRD
jgi:hypothetical protein